MSFAAGAAMAGGSIASSLISASATKKAAKEQAEAIEAASKRQAAVAKLQIYYQASESNKQTLIGLLQAKQSSRQVYTLPTTAPMRWLDKVNWQIHSFIQSLKGGNDGG